jgi:hypothetical protein
LAWKPPIAMPVRQAMVAERQNRFGIRRKDARPDVSREGPVLRNLDFSVPKPDIGQEFQACKHI